MENKLVLTHSAAVKLLKKLDRDLNNPVLEIEVSVVDHTVSWFKRAAKSECWKLTREQAFRLNAYLRYNVAKKIEKTLSIRRDTLSRLPAIYSYEKHTND